MKIDVLGLGDSFKEFTPSKNITIGVNDIYKTYKVDYLILVDKPERFTKDRLKTIIESTPLKFYSHINDWERLVPNFCKINLAKGRGNIEHIETQDLCYSNNSTYVAVVLAYKIGAKEINLFGIDFNNHKFIKDSILETTKKDFKQLINYLKSKGVKVNISKGSSLI